MHHAMVTWDPLMFEVEISITKLRKHKSPGNNRVMAELIQRGGKILYSKIHKLINSIWNNNELPQQWQENITVSIYEEDKTDCTNYRQISLLSTSYKCYQIILSQG
jgi:hypothetical protein